MTTLSAVLASSCSGGCGAERGGANAAQEQIHAKADVVCALLHGVKYCFDRAVAYVHDPKGFLLELPLRELDHPCNRQRRLYPSVFVLFDSAAPPPSVNFTPRWSSETLRILPPQDFLFTQSTREMVFCQSAPGRSIVLCQHIAQWKSGTLKFTYDGNCAIQAREYAKRLEVYVSKSAR